MAASIEDILLLKAQQDAANRENNGLAIAAGATLGAGAGILMGDKPQMNAREKLLNSLAKETVIPYAPKGIPVGTRLSPGKRFAGGLVGLMTGGALGAGVQQMMTSQSPAANLLAKVQTGQELTALELGMLEDTLTDTYSQIIRV